MSKCTDDIWLESVVSRALAEYMVSHHFINEETDLDVNTGWGTYNISLPIQLDQISHGIMPPINARLTAEGCPNLVIPVGQWTLDHLPGLVATYIADVAALTPKHAGV
jgi:hypothetical protein